MNIKQKAIEAMVRAVIPMPKDGEATPDINIDAFRETCSSELDAALAVFADPANWTEEMSKVSGSAYPANGELDFERVEFQAVINYIRGMET